MSSQLIRSNIIRLYRNIRLIALHGELGIQGSSYSSASTNQQDAAIAHLLKIYNEAKNNGVKKFVVLGIPTATDFKYFIKNMKTRNLEPWEQVLINFSIKHEDFRYVDGFSVLDKLPNARDYQRLFLQCDGHWSEFGANANASAVAEALLAIR